LVISGILLNAENLEPMPNTMVGLHSNLADSAFTALPFLRTSMTNDRGQFWIRNIAPGTYRLFALSDQNRNFKFDQPNEDIAFHDFEITPEVITDIRMDTIHTDSITIDTIREIRYSRHIPDDIILFLFNERRKTQYLSRIERPTERQLIIRFNSDLGLPPALHLLDGDNPASARSTDWFVAEHSADRKDITYWITDSLVYKRDTIQVKADYLITDSLNNLVSITDTLRFVWRGREAARRNEPDGKPDFLGVEWTVKSTMDVFDTLRITFSEPVIDFDPSKIQIQQKVDTLWENRTFPIMRDTLNPRMFYVNRQWAYEQEFQISIDSAAIFSVYGNWNDSIGVGFRFYSERDYGNLYVRIIGSEGSGFGELLDSSERVVRRSNLIDDELVFEDLRPGKYFVRYIEDTNENGIWDTGNYEEKRQPEKVYYFHDALPVTRFGSHEQDWDIRQLPIERQKPLEITKNKPVVRQQPRRDAQRQNTGGNNPLGGSIPGLGGRSIPGF
jgi:uncharacterized protein (DUF2141 family)